jgi:hypothetical protein
MLGDGLKTPLADSLNRVSIQRATDAIEELGMALPCHVTAVSGQIVTVAFDVVTAKTLPQVTIPVATSAYDWIPVQVGMRGMTIPADVALAGLSGLGTGTATLGMPAGNLSPLVFVPVSNASWEVPNVDQRVVQGPAGVLIRDLAATATVDVTEGQVVLNAGGHSVVISSAGVVIDGKVFLGHQHTGVQTGSGDSGPVL